MKRASPSLHRLLLVAGLATLPAFAGAVDLDALVKRSPFGEAKSATVTEKPSNLEFRGMYVDHGITFFSIYNTTTKLSSWVAQGEAPAGLVPVSVKSYDAETDSIILENAGQPVKLSLRQSVIGVAPAATAPIPQVAAVATNFQTPSTEGGFSRGGFNNGQPPTAEQVAAFREQMKSRGMERQGGGESNAEGGAAPTDSSKRDSSKYSRGGETTSAGAVPTSNKDDKRSRGGK
ncbi:MAG: hypothetical protein CK522_04115 [Opitutia bacterium]|nr:MAG: hypothetical protein CK522_04115 [Opitutae bacterium]